MIVNVALQMACNDADDLSAPMKGPFRTERGGDCALHRAGIALAKVP